MGFFGLLGLSGVALSAPQVSTSWLGLVLKTARDQVATALGGGFVLIHDNSPLPSEAQPTWARVTATVDSITLSTMGTGQYRASGTLTVGIFTPRARGDASALSNAELLLSQLRGRRVASPVLLRFTAASIVGGVEFADAWCGRTVRATFSAEKDDMPAT